MNELPFSPEEFARLLSLPAEHPERVRAESSGMLEAWRLMLEEFEHPPARVASSDELEAADHALDRHVAGILDAARPGRQAPEDRSAGGRGFLSRLAMALFMPAARPAIALTAILIAVGGVWWAGSRPTLRAVRGGNAESAIVLTVRETSRDLITLSWDPVPGAETYRVRFFGASLREIARLDGLPAPTLRLERGRLPGGLQPGMALMAEVSAIRGGDVIAVSSSQALRVP